MGAIADRAGITLASAKTRLGVSGTAEDAEIQEIVDMALEAADNYVNNAFLDVDGAELPIPAIVKRGVYKLVAMEYNAGLDGVELEAKSVKEGDVAITYNTWEERLELVSGSYWRAYRMEPGL